MRSMPEQPLIIASNHPNSFFDALIIATNVSRELHFLARGDAFKNKFVAAVLRSMNMVPIFRASEGKENLANNEASFTECVAVLRNGGAILIFAEGICENTWALRPLKKGTARLAQRTWHEGTDMLVVPVTLAYDSFSHAPKGVAVRVHRAIDRSSFTDVPPNKFSTVFNQLLSNKLADGIAKPDFENRQAFLKQTLLALPALVGFISQYWFYALWRQIVKSKTRGTVFYDSMLFVCLLATYPFFVIIVAICAVAFTGNANWWLLMVALPITAWCMKTFRYANR